jgi:polysaccharide biosynthesis transport protein
MDSKDLILLLWRGARLLIAGFIFGAALGFAASRLQTPVYEAKTQVLISRARRQSNTDMLPLGEDQLVSTNIQLVKSQPVLNAASAQLGINVKADNVTVSTIPNTLIIQIKVQDSDRLRAANIANTLVQVLIQQNENLVSERYTAFESSLNGQIDQIQSQINDLQSQINQINDASILEQLTQVNQQINQLKAELSTLENEINSYPTILSEMQRLSLGEKQASLEQLRSLLDIYQQIQTNLTFIGKPGQSGLSRDDPRVNSLQSTLNLYQELYLDLVNSRETVSLDRMQNTPNLTQINPAIPSKDPVRPLPLLYVLLGGVVGVFLSATAILTMDHMDESLKTIRQTEELLHLPVLGLVSDSYHASDGLVTLHRPSSPEAEAFRSLGVSVEFAVPKKTVHTLLVISADPGKNKTTVAANLGIVNAQQGKRVLLLDGDLKVPHLHSLFGFAEEGGMVNILEKDVDIKSVSRSVDGVKGMTLIPSGSVTENLVSWRNGEKWQEVLIKLQKQADLVIVDGPSVETATAQQLASKVDAVLLLIQLRKTRVDSATTALRQLQLVSARVAGIVLFRAPTYRRIQLRNFHWARAIKKGGSQETGNQLNEETVT